MARRHRRAPALALLVVAALCLHVQAMSPIYQAMSTMYNSELSRGLQLGEGSEACCEHLEHVACICDDHEEGTPDLITIDLPETATTHRCDTDNLQLVHHEDTETHVCVPEDYSEEHVDAYPENQKDDAKDDVEISPLPEESHISAPGPSDPSQPIPQTVVVVQCNQQSDSSSTEELIVIRNNDEVTVVSGDKSNTDIVVVQESTKLSEGDTVVLKETSIKEHQVDDSIDVTIVRGSFESSISSSSASSISSSSSSESVSNDSSCESDNSSSTESSSGSSNEEEKSPQRHCKRVPSCKCGKCMLRRKLQQQQKEKKQKKQKKQRQRKRQHQKTIHKQKQRQKHREKRHS